VYNCDRCWYLKVAARRAWIPLKVNDSTIAGPHHWPEARWAMVIWAPGEKLNMSYKTAPTSAGLRLLDTITESGSLEDLMILGSGSGTGQLDIALKDAIQSWVWWYWWSAGLRLLEWRTLADSNMELAEAALCHLWRKGFEQGLLNKNPSLHLTLQHADTWSTWNPVPLKMIVQHTHIDFHSP